MPERLWWQKPLRVIQTNLQVKDTPRMDPAKIAAETAAMGANVLVTNVGGIYAWYDSKVRYHHVNEYLPESFDLLDALLRECHKRDIRLVARYDFSKTDDYVLQERPQWFVRDRENNPRAYGISRHGDWSILYTTCINGGYRGGEVAVPVIRESLTRYAFDGVFFNAPHYERCFCGACREKYRRAYGKELPLSDSGGDMDDSPGDGSPTLAWRGLSEEMEPDWGSRCVGDNIAGIYNAIKEINPDTPMILYYNPFTENVDERLATADMLCTESQNILSLGHRDLPPIWHPAISMKVGRTADAPPPFGIIHSCPGMDWRHTGLPPAEYRFWMAQVPANGGSLWHSITGFADTISDKRLLDAVSDLNHMIERTEEEMDGAVSGSETLLIWNGGSSGRGWLEALNATGQQYDPYGEYQLTAGLLAKYKAVILPEGGASEQTVALLRDYVEGGGSLLLEATECLEQFGGLTGTTGQYATSEYLAASYLRFEDGGGLQRDLERTPLIAHRGAVAYCTPAAGAKVLATLVPPFAPLDAVGAPPERASMNVSRTDLPLAVLSGYGGGKVLFLPFQLSMLVREYRLGEHCRFASNCLDLLLGEAKPLETNCPKGVQAVLWRKPDRALVHLVNGVGERPLADNVPIHDVELRLPVPAGKRVKDVVSRIAGETVRWTQEDGRVLCSLPRLRVWDMLSVIWEG